MKTVVMTSRRLRMGGYVQLDADDPKTRWPLGTEVELSEENFNKLQKADLVDIEEVTTGADNKSGSDNNESGGTD